MKKLMSNVLNRFYAILIIASLFIGVISAFPANTVFAEGVKLPTDEFLNDLSNEDLYPFYNKLDDNQKNAYEKILEGIKNCEETIVFATKKDDNGVQDEKFKEVLNAIYYEHPELFWFGSINENSVGYTISSEGYSKVDETGHYIIKEGTVDIKSTFYTEVSPTYNEYAEDLESSKATLQEIVDEILEPTEGMSDAEKIYHIHNEICKRVCYDYDGLDSGKLDATVYGTLTRGKAVCQGYARTLQYLLRMVGIPSSVVIGNAYPGIKFKKGDDGEIIIEQTDPESHEWNIVKYNENYYNIDVTWDDLYDEDQAKNPFSYIKFNYFMVDDEYVIENAVESEGKTYNPELKFTGTGDDGDTGTHIRNEAFEFLPNCTTEFDFEDEFGFTREDAFETNFDNEQSYTRFTSLDQYISAEKESVIKGTSGSLTLKKTSEGEIVASGEKAACGEKFIQYFNIPDTVISSVHNAIESVTMKFFVTSGELFNSITTLKRDEIGLSDYYSNALSYSGFMYAARYISYYELQNGCYVLEVTPDIIYENNVEVSGNDKTVNMLEWTKDAGTLDATKGKFLDLSSVESKIKAYFNDFTTGEIDYENLVVEGYDCSKEGEQEVTITYKYLSNDPILNPLKLKINVTKTTPALLGDADGSGQVNSNDAIRVLMYSMFQHEYTVDQGVDYNGDGKINTDDAIRLLMYSVFPEDGDYALKN